MLTCKEVPCVENLQIVYCVNYCNIPGYCCQQSTFFVIVTETLGILWCRKGTAFCKRPFTLHRKQLENDKQNVDFAPPGKISADAHDDHHTH